MPRYTKPKIGRPKGTKDAAPRSPRSDKRDQPTQVVQYKLEEETLKAIEELKHIWGLRFPAHVINKAIQDTLRREQDARPLKTE